MSQDIWNHPDSLHFTASDFRWLCSEEHRCAALEVKSDSDTTVIITLPEGLSRVLREHIRQAFEVYPTMEDWGSHLPL